MKRSGLLHQGLPGQVYQEAQAAIDGTGLGMRLEESDLLLQLRRSDNVIRIDNSDVFATGVSDTEIALRNHAAVDVAGVGQQADARGVRPACGVGRWQRCHRRAVLAEQQLPSGGRSGHVRWRSPRR